MMDKVGGLSMHFYYYYLLLLFIYLELYRRRVHLVPANQASKSVQTLPN